MQPSNKTLQAHVGSFGQKNFEFLPKQWEFCFSKAPELAFVSGYGSGKTCAGIYRATLLSTQYPGNKGLIGRYASTDLAATTQADAIEFWQEANLLDDFKEKGKYKVPTATLRCLDGRNKIIPGKYSEVLFQHLDNPTHIHGHHLGWAWMDEASESSIAAFRKLLSRLRRPGFEGLYSLFISGNPNGHDWMYNHFFNPEILSKLTPQVKSKRHAIKATTYENHFLPQDYVQNMVDSYSETERKIFLEGSFDVFEGQLYEEFKPSTHVFRMKEVFPLGIPESWNRILSLDVGGSDPWAWIWSAIDPHGNVIIYDKIYRPGTRVAPFAIEARKKIGGLKFQSKVMDYENKVVQGELREHGVNMTNAQKRNKNDSIFRVSGYLHPNPNHGYPDWHPKKGQKGSPRMFIADKCKELIEELPQQRWLQKRGQDTFENVIDPNTVNHAHDALCYMVRELPKPTDLDRTIISDLSSSMSKMGKIMNFELREARQQKKKNLWAAHMGHGGRFSGRKTSYRGLL